jgi:monothiol glutaredoxin
MTDTLKKIDEQVKNHSIVLYMKGTPRFPQCGFSSKAVALLADCIQQANEQLSGHEFFSVDVLAEPAIRQTLPQYSQWPTFPQLFVKGELVGGCDIMTELHQQGELQRLVKEALSQ